MKTKKTDTVGKVKTAGRLHLAQPNEVGARQPAEPLSAETRRNLAAAARSEGERSKAGKLSLPAGFKIAYNVHEAAAAIGASEWYIRNEIALGMLAVSKPRGKLLIPRSELERYIEANLQKAVATQAAGKA